MRSIPQPSEVPPQSSVVAVPGFIDSHAHLLKDSAGVAFPASAAAVREFHQQVARQGSTPMDVAEPLPAIPPWQMAARLKAGLDRAAGTGLVEVTEMGMRDWWYLDALARLQADGPLPVRVRIYLASGLAEQAGQRELAARRGGAGPWVTLDGIKFYADGWLGSRTCAMGQDFDDAAQPGTLFMDAGTLARRIEPFIARGWRIATHAIGDRGVQAVLDGYHLAWDGDLAAMAAAAPRIEHASVQSAELIARMAAAGVVACIQPSFAVTDVRQVQAALSASRRAAAYPWAALAASGVAMLAGSDYPIEVLEPLVGLARLVSGRSEREGFGTTDSAPEHSRLAGDQAFALLSDQAAGTTLLSADPRTASADQIDNIEVLGATPAAFRPR